MVATFVLIAGVLFILIVGFVLFASMGLSNVLISLVPLAPGLVMIGTFMLITTEIILFFGNKEDKRIAKRDLAYMLPTFLISGVLWFIAQNFLW